MQGTAQPICYDNFVGCGIYKLLNNYVVYLKVTWYCKWNILHKFKEKKKIPCPKLSTPNFWLPKENAFSKFTCSMWYLYSYFIRIFLCYCSDYLVFHWYSTLEDEYLAYIISSSKSYTSNIIRVVVFKC